MVRKKYKWGQQKEWKADQEEQERRKDERRPGLCDKCGRGRFSLRMENRHLVRTCKHCGHEINPESGEPMT